MNTRTISPVLVVVLAIASLLPVAPIARVHALNGIPTVHVDPSIVSLDPGSLFPAAVYVSDVQDLIAYDVTLQYNTAALTAVSVDFDMTVFFGMPKFTVVQSVNDAIGEIRTAVTLVGGATKDVAAPEPVFNIEFMVDNALDSPLHITDDSSLVQLVAGSPQLVPLSPDDTIDGQFLAPPKVELHRWNATVAPGERQRFLSRGEFSVTLIATLRMTSKAPSGGFAFVVFDVLDPNGNFSSVVTETIFMAPGQVIDLTVPFVYAPVTGRYEIFATVWRGPSTSFFAIGESTTGLHFIVKP